MFSFVWQFGYKLGLKWMWIQNVADLMGLV